MIDIHPDDRPKVFAFALFGAPLLAWLTVAAWIRQHADGLRPNLLLLARDTVHGSAPGLLVALFAGLVVGVASLMAVNRLGTTPAGGAPFRTHLRGTRVVTKPALVRATRERGEEQVTVAGVPMPTSVETFHLLVAGSTGSGKSVALARAGPVRAPPRRPRHRRGPERRHAVAVLAGGRRTPESPRRPQRRLELLQRDPARLRLQAIRPLPRPPRKDQGGGGVVLLRPAPPLRDRAGSSP